MRKILFLLVMSFALFTACSTVKEQQKRNISSETSANAGEGFIPRKVSQEEYNQLLSRYEQNDTTLALSDYNALYYGQEDQEGYSGYGARTSDETSQIEEILNSDEPSQEDWAKAYEIGKNISKIAPFSIDNIFFCYIASKRAGNIDESKKWLYKFNRLIDVIVSSGDGLSAKTAFKVMCVRDEYEILKVLGLQFTKQALVSEDKKPYDVMSVKENEYEIEKVYFDISSFFGKFNFNSKK